MLLRLLLVLSELRCRRVPRLRRHGGRCRRRRDVGGGAGVPEQAAARRGVGAARHGKSPKRCLAIGRHLHLLVLLPCRHLLLLLLRPWTEPRLLLLPLLPLLLCVVLHRLLVLQVLHVLLSAVLLLLPARLLTRQDIVLLLQLLVQVQLQLLLRLHDVLPLLLLLHCGSTAARGERLEARRLLQRPHAGLQLRCLVLHLRQLAL
mmetsp:Transcript_17854/g.51382  ORF Transcript_17854/g.51382 Transcript_17854/m.51382 type:complete len:204 (-) Transcript_17854:251-862(-)